MPNDIQSIPDKPNWIGFVLLHPKELPNLEEIKNKVIEDHGSFTFELKDSPSSGEIFTRFKELHVYKAVAIEDIRGGDHLEAASSI